MAFCANCEKNAGLCNEMDPPKYKCAIDNTYHDKLDGCDLYDKGYQQGKIDAINDCIDAIKFDWFFWEEGIIKGIIDRLEGLKNEISE